MNYNLNQITKLLEKIFKAGFKTEKEILSIQLEDLQKIPDITGSEIMIILELKKAIKGKRLIAFFSGYKEESEEMK